MHLRAPPIVVLAAGALLALAVFTNVASEPEEALLEPTGYSALSLSIEGSRTAPDAVRLGLPGVDGKPLFEASVVRSGLDPRVFLTVAGPDAEVYEVGGSILVAGDLDSPVFKLYALKGATETFSARVENTGTSPSVDVWVNGTPDAPSHYHLESPLRYRLDGGDMHSLVVLDPTTPNGGDAYLRLDKTPTGYRLAARDQAVNIVADAVEVQRPGDGRTTLVFRDVDGAQVQRADIDSRSDPAMILLTGQVGRTIAGPLALEGDAASPRRLVVYAPDGSTLLKYAATDGRSTVDVGGRRLVEDATLLRIQGDPFTQSFTLHLRNASGGHDHAVSVDRALLLDAGAQHDLPIVEVLAPLSTLSGMPEGMLDLVHTERGGALASAQLDGAHPLAASGTHTAFLHTAQDAPAFDRILLTVRTGGHITQSAFRHVGDVEGGAVWSAAYVPSALGPMNEGQKVTLDVLYEKRLAPFAVQSYHDARTYAYTLDGVPPTVRIEAPATSDDYSFEVSWSGTDGTGIRGYEAQYREAGAPTWQRWVEETDEPGQTFSGEWATAYQFRVRSHDLVGNPSEWAEAATTVAAQPAGEDDVNDPPTVRILAPRAGDRLAGLVSVQWSASDPDGTPVTVNVQVSSDDGRTWRTLGGGTRGSYAWDTALEPDGLAYRLRATATDGTLSSADATGAFTIANHAVARQALASSAAGQSGSTPDGDGEGGAAGEGGAGGTDGTDGTARMPGAGSAADGAGDAQAQGEDDGGFLGIPGPGALALLGAAGVAAYAFRGGARRSR